MQSFPILFTQVDEESQDEQGDNQPVQQTGLVQFGIIPYILEYCKATNETFSTAMKQPVNLVLYITSYKVMEYKEQKKELDKIRMNRK